MADDLPVWKPDNSSDNTDPPVWKPDDQQQRPQMNFAMVNGKPVSITDDFKNAVNKGVDWATKPLIKFPEPNPPKGIVDQGLDMIGHTIEELTSPANLALTAASFGSNLAGRAGLTGISKLLEAPSMLAAGGMTGKGLYDIGSSFTDPDKSLPAGLLETGLGALGFRSSIPKVTNDLDRPAQLLMNSGEVTQPVKPRFRITDNGDVVNAETGEVVNLHKQNQQISYDLGGGTKLNQNVGKLPPTVDIAPQIQPPAPTTFLDELKKAAKTPFKSAIDLSKSLVTAGHFSAPFRQGAMLMSHPSDFYDAFVKMFQAAGSEDNMKLINDTLTKKPNFFNLKDAGLVLTDLGDSPSMREDYIRSKLAESIPGYGKIVRMGNRAYNTFSNVLRVNVGDSIWQDAADAAKNLTGEAAIAANPETNKVLARSITSFVNAASGRGSLGMAEKYADALNTVLFSPRLQAGRAQVLAMIVAPSTPPIVRKEAIKSLLALTSMGLTVNGLAKLGGGETTLDPTSSDFGKAKIGNVRIDPWAGYQQYAVLAARLMNGGYTSSTTDRYRKFGSYGAKTMFGGMEDFAANKLSPPMKFAYDLLNAKDSHGQSTFQATPEIANMMVPIIAKQVYEISQENPQLLPASLLGTFGMGVEAYH